jgi:hypothetical protein
MVSVAQGVRTAARFAGILALVLTGLLVALTSVLLLLIWSCQPPSLSTLASRFQDQEKDLKTIVAMNEQDASLVRIDPAWLETYPYTQYFAAVPESGITPQRWNQYRLLFSRNSIEQGIQRDHDTGDAFIRVKAFGLLDRGTSTGYVYCGPGPKHIYPPCNSSDPIGSHPYSPGDEAYSWRKLEDRWYAYSEGPG